MNGDQHTIKLTFVSTITVVSTTYNCVCVTELLTGVTPPGKQVYATEEPQAIEEYCILQKLLNTNICLSKLSAFTRFFFLEKEAGGLRLSIDFYNLNQVTVKFLLFLRSPNRLGSSSKFSLQFPSSNMLNLLALYHGA